MFIKGNLTGVDYVQNDVWLPFVCSGLMSGAMPHLFAVSCLFVMKQCYFCALQSGHY